jgi:hypothetical protein
MFAKKLAPVRKVSKRSKGSKFSVDLETQRQLPTSSPPCAKYVNAVKEVNLVFIYLYKLAQ